MQMSCLLTKKKVDLLQEIYLSCVIQEEIQAPELEGTSWSEFKGTVQFYWGRYSEDSIFCKTFMFVCCGF